jgi:hypothetical protein
MRARLLTIEIVNIVLFPFFILAVISFVTAITPQQAEQLHQLTMPSTWEAGVFSHGSYYRWITITGHPILFALSILGLLISISTVAYVHRRL